MCIRLLYKRREIQWLKVSSVRKIEKFGGKSGYKKSSNERYVKLVHKEIIEWEKAERGVTRRKNELVVIEELLERHEMDNKLKIKKRKS